MNRHLKSLILLFLIAISCTISPLVGPIVPGRSLWYIYKKLGMTFDIIESKVCLIEETLDSTESKIDEVATTDEFLSIGDILCSKAEALMMDPMPVMASGLDTLEMVLCSKIELIDSEVDVLDDKVDNAFLCMATPITAPTTITEEGFYCVANDITDAGSIITINSVDNVVIDVNNHVIESTGAKTIDVDGSNRIEILNGTVVAQDANVGIEVSNGDDIKINDITTRHSGTDGGIGISLLTVTNGLIEDSQIFDSTAIGVSIGGFSRNVTVNNTIAQKIAASTASGTGFAIGANADACCLNECKAVGCKTTGFSINGDNHVVENCIANGADGQSDTTFSTRITGFELQSSAQHCKIIGCEAGNATSPVDGAFAIGIRIAETLSALDTQTGVEFTTTTTGFSVDWSSDGKYIVAAYSGNNQSSDFFNIYAFDYDDPSAANNVDIRLISSTSAGSIEFTKAGQVRWSPDNTLLAVGGSGSSVHALKVYKFESVTQELTLADQISLSSAVAIRHLEWSLDQRYLAVLFADSVQVYAWDAINEQLTPYGSAESLAEGGYSLSWNPNSRYLVVGSETSVTAGQIELFSLNTSNNPGLTSVQTIVLSADADNVVVAWSPDGKFVAEANGTTASTAIRGYTFDPSISVLTEDFTLTTAQPSGDATAISWGADSRRFILALSSGFINSYIYDAVDHEIGASTDEEVFVENANDVIWSPDGQYIVTVGDDAQDVPNEPLQVTLGLTMAKKNVIKDNVVYCNTSGSSCHRGIGISGSSIANLIVGNTAYNNPSDPEVIGTNYAYVLNVFNQLFQLEPTDLQNISIDGCVPICSPADIALLEKQIKHKVCDVASQQDVIESKIALNTDQCAPTPITSSTTITEEGVYCVGNPITNGPIVVDTSNVLIDMGGYRLAGGVEITSGVHQVTLQNGVVEGTASTDAIKVNSGTSQIYIEDVITKNALVGINMENVTGAQIVNCDMVSNVTGMQLSDSHKIIVENSTASCNTNAGFDLLNSTTCFFEECKALSTGEGNTQVLDQTIFGFVSTDGFGNIFERCIVNSTQALSTTDFNSVVAGFALRGDEKCSKIIDSESANATTSPSGVTVPYGILLEARFDGLVTATAWDLGGYSNEDYIFSLAWSPDGKYLALGGSRYGANDDDLFIYRFDRIAEALTLIETVNVGGFSYDDAVNSVAWSPDGAYLAVGGNRDAANDDDLFIYRFDQVTETLTLINSVDAGGSTMNDNINSVAWSSDGAYLAVGGNRRDVDDDDLFIYRFDRVAETLTLKDSVNIGGTSYFNRIISVSWSPDGAYLAAGGTQESAYNDDDLFIYGFDRTTETLTLKDSVEAGGYAMNDYINSVAWSPDGAYLAVGGNPRDTNDSDVFIYLFDRTAETLILKDAVNIGGSAFSEAIFSVAWSPDGSYLAAGGSLEATDDSDIFIYLFDRGTEQLNLISSVGIDGPSYDYINSVAWSPDGAYIAAGGSQYGATDDNDLFIYRALSFPSKNVIKNNTVYCNSGAQYPSGVGISGSSIQNMIIGNTAYSNPLPNMGTGGTGPIVGTNYYFVTNVFNQLFGTVPSDLQNISIDGCVPICTPDDIGLLAKQIKFKVCEIQSIQDIVESKLNINLETCAPTVITNSTTIIEEGAYCVANQITDGPIQVNTSDVFIDINGYRLEDGVVINDNVSRVTLQNGVVEGAGVGTNGIEVRSGTSQITIDGVIVKGAEVGINMENVTGGTISNCTLTQNTTGLQLNSSHKIAVDNTSAHCNTNAGFDLVNSTTCLFTDCKALSTGEGNTEVSGAVIAGFVSTDGFGNIFERCIANSTQGLTSTGFNSLIAGFALRGDEKCSKIIDSESANATSSPDGVTVPYGILLEATLNNPLTLTAYPPIPQDLGDVRCIDWSPDSKYLAVGAQSSNLLSVYRFDTRALTATRVALESAQAGDNRIWEVDWHPNGVYIAAVLISTNSTLRIYKFDTTNNSLSVVAEENVSFNTSSVSWHPSGRFVACGDSGTAISVYAFDAIAESLSFITSAPVSTNVYALDWRPDGAYLAAGLADGTITAYSFDQVAPSLTSINSIDLGAEIIFDLRWSPDGKYIAIGETPYDSLHILSWDGITLIDVAQASGESIGVDWSPDGRYVVRTDYLADLVDIFLFDRGTHELIFQSTDNFAPVTSEVVRWSPDGQWLAVSDRSNTNNFLIYEVLSFPSKNVIKDNTVYCNSGGMCPSGVGISGSSIKNMIIGNTAYSNPVPQMTEGGGPIVFSNYEFVTNVFNQMFGTAPTDLQNIALGGCEPICTPDDLGLLAKQTKAKICKLDSKVGDLEDAGSCFPTLIDVPQAINDLDLNWVELLKTLMLEIRGCGQDC